MVMRMTTQRHRQRLGRLPHCCQISSYVITMRVLCSKIVFVGESLLSTVYKNHLSPSLQLGERVREKEHKLKVFFNKTSICFRTVTTLPQRREIVQLSDACCHCAAHENYLLNSKTYFSSNNGL